MQIALIATLLASALAVWAAGKIAKRFGLPEVTGYGLALGALAIGVAMSSAQWRDWLTGEEAGERSLVFASEIGLTGLLFLAGSRMDLRKAWQRPGVSSAVAAAGLLLMAVVAILLAAFGEQDRYAIAASSAAIAAASLWLPGEISLGAKDKHQSAAESAKGAAVILTGLLLLVVHFYSLFHDVAWRVHTTSTYAIVGLYELVKITLFFALACFVVSRFLVLAQGRISTARMMIGYLLMAVLIFALTTSLIGQLGALAWSFIAGTLLARSETAKQLSKITAPIASAMFLSLAFLPVFLQSHGRSLTSFSLVALAVVGIAIGKLGMGWLVARITGASKEDAKLVAASTLASGESAVIFIGFAITRFVIESNEYFIVLSFALLSMIAGPIIRQIASRNRNVSEADEQALIHKRDRSSKKGQNWREKKGSSGKKISFAVVLIVMALAARETTAQAQSQSTVEDDPVSRAMKSVEASVNARAAAAEQVITASKLVNESTAARKQGDHARAKEALIEAKKVASDAGEFNRSALIAELARLLAAEQAMLEPKANRNSNSSTPGVSFTIKLPRSITARLNMYRDNFTQILQQEGLPVGLMGVALVESGFNPLALSPKGARGIWQIMPGTAVRYGLTVAAGNDHRTHPEHSTQAAARYLRDLYNQFGDWKLAIAAYNAGEHRVQRIIDKTGIRNFEEMSRRRLLPAETRNYVPAVLVAWSQIEGPNALAILAGPTEAGKNQTRSVRVVDALTRPDGSTAPTKVAPR